MDRRKTAIVLTCIVAVLAIALAAALLQRPTGPIESANAANFGRLLTDLVNACESPDPGSGRSIETDLNRIQTVSRRDYPIAKSIADHWRKVYLDPDYRMYLYDGGNLAEELESVEIPDSRTHAIVVLGYELKNGEMQPELMGRCEAAAAAARSFPSAILVCSGGATGENNPEKHTEAGLMKAYLVENCGIEASRIYIDEQAMTTQENAANTFRILKANHIQTMTIVTSVYHQRWGQAIYNAMAELYRQREGYSVEIVGNYSYDIEPSVPLYRHDARIAAMQIAGILELPEEVRKTLPPLKSRPTKAQPAEGRLPEIRARGVLRVGTCGDYRPMSFLEPGTGEYWGFDIELARELAEALGVELAFVPTTWPTLMEDTLAGKFDLAIGGITITEARLEQALMSDGYLGNGKTVLCRREDADRYRSLDAINRPEVRVMENPGGLNEKFARENLPDATLIIHELNQEIPGLVASGEADVMITEIMEAGYYVGQDSRLAAPLILEPFTHGQLGVLMPKGSEDLLLFVNNFLAEEKADGRIDELAEAYIYRCTDGEWKDAA